MTYPISNSSSPPETPASETRPAEISTADRPTPLATAHNQSAPHDSSSLSSVANMVFESDPAKIEALRQQYLQGSYSVDSTKVSQKILDLQFSTKGTAESSVTDTANFLKNK